MGLFGSGHHYEKRNRLIGNRLNVLNIVFMESGDLS